MAAQLAIATLPRIPARTDTLVAHALEKFTSPARWPYTERDFFRLDRGDDSEFYAEPRLDKVIDHGSQLFPWHLQAGEAPG